MTTCIVPADRVRTDLANILELGIGELEEDVDLSDLGLDSVRLMMLVDQWRADGCDVDFVSLASAPVLARWIEILDGDSVTESPS
ncbi:phosphopantetheine-binding protein [Rhodococcus gannanensis]|uniref:Phosphopantetheine-binding protein n=1 Tax=Rhodococcus gannanensis TaxID=1960308 RepID=A0ABW4PBB3_9NOCA